MLRSHFIGFAAGSGMTAGVSVWAALQGGAIAGDAIWQLLTNLLIFAALGYDYFHFVNLGDTGLRPRVLRELVEAGGALRYDQILARYNAAEVVRVRLERLVRSGQVIEHAGRYVARPAASMLWIARATALLRCMLFGKRSSYT